MIVETLALFTNECPDAQDEISVLTGDIVVDKEGDTLYPTPFFFDFCEVIAVNPSQYHGYSTIRFQQDAFTVKMLYKDAFEYFKQSKNVIQNIACNNG